MKCKYNGGLEVFSKLTAVLQGERRIKADRGGAFHARQRAARAIGVRTR